MYLDAGADFTSGYLCNGDADADQPSATAPSLSGVWRLPVPVAPAPTRVPPAPAPQPLRACASRQDSQLRQARTDLLREGGALPHVSIIYMEGLFLNVTVIPTFRVFWDIIIYTSSAQQGREQKESHDCMDRSSSLSARGRLSYNRIHYCSSVVANQPPGLQKLYR